MTPMVLPSHIGAAHGINLRFVHFLVVDFFDTQLFVFLVIVVCGGAKFWGILIRHRKGLAHYI